MSLLKICEIYFRKNWPKIREMKKWKNLTFIYYHNYIFLHKIKQKVKNRILTEVLSFSRKYCDFSDFQKS